MPLVWQDCSLELTYSTNVDSALLQLPISVSIFSRCIQVLRIIRRICEFHSKIAECDNLHNKI